MVKRTSRVSPRASRRSLPSVPGGSPSARLTAGVLPKGNHSDQSSTCAAPGAMVGFPVEVDAHARLMRGSVILEERRMKIESCGGELARKGQRKITSRLCKRPGQEGAARHIRKAPLAQSTTIARSFRLVIFAREKERGCFFAVCFHGNSPVHRPVFAASPDVTLSSSISKQWK